MSQYDNMNPRWLKIPDAITYSAIGKKRLVQMCRNGVLRAYQDEDNKMAWIIDRLSIDEYHDSHIPISQIKNKLKFHAI